VILRPCICIPTYNNPLTIQKVIEGCLDLYSFPVIVIDDGSTNPVSDLLVDSRVTFIRHETNLGKGKALQTAFKEAVRQGFTHLISIDGDGQHLPSEIQKLVALALQNPWNIIIGNRKLVSQTVPTISKFGRSFSNFWVTFQTEAKISDSQSGFRIYPLFHVQNLKFFTKGFDFEIEVLIRLLWKGVQVIETEIEVYYPAPEDRVSHFDKFWDNVKISTLNVVLVIISLLKTGRSPFDSALSLGLGVAVGCTPFFGFHTMIVAALSFIFRLNAIYLFLGTQISAPPLVPILMMISVKIGHILHVNSAHTALGFSINWLVGSLILGGALGFISGLATYWLLRRRQEQATAPQAWNGKTRGGRFGNWFLKNLMKKFGLAPTYFCLIFIVPYFYIFAPKSRHSANEYWSILRPDKKYIPRQWFILKQLFVFAQILVDRVYQSFYDNPQFKTNPMGMQNIIDSSKSPTGLVIMTAHIGAWDLSSALLKSDGFSGQFLAVQFESHGLTLNKVKENSGNQHLTPLFANQESQAILNIRQWLEEGKPIGLMGDRPLGGQFELIPFLGKLAPIDCTPFRIAAACRSPLLFAFGFKSHRKVYDFYATDAKVYIYSNQHSKTYQCLEWAEEYAAVLEKFVRIYPEQWSNYFKFWSTVPGAQNSKSKNYLLQEAYKPISQESVERSGPNTTDDIRFRP
jgi:predicted LPLAT superfamily acyltransferase/glycosyltransferase involved in cell wall biosynthesis